MSTRGTLSEALTRLSAHLAAGRLASSTTFATSLLTQYRTRGLSTKQADWVYRLLERAEAGTAPAPDPLDVRPLLALFARAKAAGLRFPKIRLRQSDGSPLVLSMAGERSQAPGSLTATDGARYPDNRYYGRISPDGTYTAGRDASPASLATLRELATDPAGRAAIHGHASGSCCFCNRALDDSRSVAVGYGPICAGKYGLPWGEVSAPPITLTPVETLA
jgi:hypothetical protein